MKISCLARHEWFGSFALAMLAGCIGDAGPTAKTDNIAPLAVKVKTVAVAPADLARTTVQPATVHAYFRAEIRAKVSGYVQALKADIGDYVEAGAELAVIAVPELDKQRRTIEARVLRFEAEVQQAHAGVELAAAKVRSAEAKLAESKSQLSRADARLAAAESEFARTSDLVKRQSLEDRMLDEVRQRRDSELANKQAMNSAISSAEAEVGVARAEQKAAEANVQAAVADSEIARRQLDELDVLVDFATLKAPFTGVVYSRSINPGDLVRESSEVGAGQPLFVLSQVDKLRVQIHVPEVDAAVVTAGSEVSLTFPSFPAEQPISSTVTRVSGGLDPSTRTMLVEVELLNPDGKILPGMFGQATIALATKVAANMLPARAVRFDEKGKAYVYVVGQDKSVSVVPITTGLDDGRTIEVLSGVEPGQSVIDAHLKRFAAGQKVTVLPD